MPAVKDSGHRRGKSKHSLSRDILTLLRSKCFVFVHVP